MANVVRLFFENAQGAVSPVGSYQLAEFSTGVESVKKQRLWLSFGTLIAEIEAVSGSNISVLLNGLDEATRVVGGAYVLRLKLDRDLAFHRLSVVALPTHAVTIDIEVEHRYFPSGVSERNGVSKWTSTRLKNELGKYKSFFANTRQLRVDPDDLHGDARSGQTDSTQVLLQIIGRLDMLLSRATHSEAQTDFHQTTFGDFDRDAAYFSDRGRLFQADRGRRFSVIVDAQRCAQARY